MTKKLIIHTDGGARGNPGPAGIGVMIKDDKGKEVKTIAKYLGKATNNQAEYQAVLAGIEAAVKLKATEAEFYLDSELVVKQLNREYKVKNLELQPLFVKVYNHSLKFKKISFHHVRREQNKEADALANLAMDKEDN
ncbi:MAG: Ribonuclease H [Candidatus Falkowbacteria bacterium GW2011_GWA2_39_24]|uniref:Ribonuclease H n=1 Tax=Candidatus Falkowbacteria bacterium GW2011_GWA2_39_24 TaxID=1618634 RepID=A0A0G0NQ64_9BACT|nr:MAG: Ribonuclease H [Candidatus Falkowbacteria bacterium GW2011_GWA2_39_24]